MDQSCSDDLCNLLMLPALNERVVGFIEDVGDDCRGSLQGVMIVELRVCEREHMWMLDTALESSRYVSKFSSHQGIARRGVLALQLH